MDPALRAAVAALGTHVAARLTREGKPGVVVNAIYDAWTPARAYPHTHGGVRVLSETASARLATPIEMPFEDLERGIGYDPRSRPGTSPVRGRAAPGACATSWTTSSRRTRRCSGHAARNREFWLRTFLDVNRRAAARTEPVAFVLPPGQRDPAGHGRAAARRCATGGVEIASRARALHRRGPRFDAGAHVVLMPQP